MQRIAVMGILGSVVFSGVSHAAVGLQQVATGLNQPTFLTAPNGDASRLFVLEKGGNVRLIENGVLQSTPYMSVPVDTSGERGLLGMAFAPDFATSGVFYLDYINATTLATNVVKYTVGNPAASVATGQVQSTTVFTAAQPAGRDNHKGGWIGFRPGEPNNLYIATGDGGSGNDPDNNAQNLSSPLGKIHRIDVSGNGVAVPAAGNPFVGGSTTADDTVWAYGLRNPFRDSFDRVTGNFYIADVGQGAREEVNVENSAANTGRNYGWRPREGTGPTPGVNEPTPSGAVDPVFEYSHSSPDFAGGSASITGGYVYRGSLAPELYGQYIFGDFVSGKLGSFTYDPITGTVSGVSNIDALLDPTNLIGTGSLSSFGEGGTGELYLVSIGGAIYAVVPEPSYASAALAASGALLRRRR